MAATHTTASLLGWLARATAAPGYPTPVITMRMPPFIATGEQRAGRGVINGTVKIKGAPNYPVRRRVRLFRDRDGLCVGETWSDDATGEYQFAGINEAHRYTAIAYDHTHSFRAVVADNLTPDLMP